MLGVGYTSVDYGNAYRFNGGPGGIVPHADRENARSRVVRVVDPAERNQAGRNAKGGLNPDIDRRQQAADDQNRSRTQRRSPRLDVSLPSARNLKFGASLAFQAQQIAQGDASIAAPAENTTKTGDGQDAADATGRPHSGIADFTASQAYQDTADMASVTILPPLPENVKLPTLV